MRARGIFGVLGLVRDYRAFRQQGTGRLDACLAAFDYWQWDRETWMAWDGRPRDAAIRKLFR
jgi:hypothetical protein